MRFSSTLRNFFTRTSLIYAGRKDPVSRADHKRDTTGLMESVIAVHPGRDPDGSDAIPAALRMYRAGIITTHGLA
ncbi:hypothetical protein JNE25005_47170 (plasmid) [Escherichia coli]